MGQVVGVAVLRQEEQVDYLRAHYNLEDFVYFNYHRPEEHGHLHHCILNPIFHGHTRHFLSVSMHCSCSTHLTVGCVYMCTHTVHADVGWRTIVALNYVHVRTYTYVHFEEA